MLQEYWGKIVREGSVRSVVCVNCGAGVDLGGIFGLDDEEEVEGGVGGDEEEEWLLRVYVVDCKRPFHLANVESGRVFLINDNDTFDESELPNIGYEDVFGFVDDDSEDDEEDDDDDVLVSDREEGFESEDSLGYEDDDVVFSGEEREQRKRRRKRSGQRKRKRRIRLSAEERERREEARAYYSSAFFAMSSACIGHRLCTDLNKGSLDTLWLAIVGVTDQFLNLRISTTFYEEALDFFKTQIAQLEPATEVGNESESAVLDVGYSASQGSSSSSKRVIAPSTELRLDMVRHWNLHDSLLYSTYTITRLAAWRQTGRRRLLEFLAVLGIPLQESRQKWCYMKSDCKSALDERLATTIRRFNLGRGIRYDSYVRSMPGHWGSVSAADVVFSACALLEFDQASGSSEGASMSFDKLVEKRFWTAYDATSFQKPDLLSNGLSLAIDAQKLVAEVGGEVLERRKFVPSGPFRYAFLRDLQSKHTFAHPLLLNKLALFLIEALIQRGTTYKPFVVLAPDPARNVWIAVGATGRNEGRNDFGTRFKRAAAKNGSQVTYDGFNSAIVEIEDGQESEFIHVLHDVM